MNAINNIIQDYKKNSQVQNQTFKNDSANTLLSFTRNKRPYLKLTFDEFSQKFIEAGNQILAKRPSGNSFKVIKEHIPFIRELYLYAICDRHSKLALNKGICLAGSFGIGKTVILQTITELFNYAEYSKNVRSINAKEYVTEINQDKSIVDFYKKRPLFIDDIGQETTSVNSYGTIIEPIRELISTRYDNGAFTLATTNFKYDSLKKLYGQHIVDRFYEMVTVVNLMGENLRLNN